MSTQTVPTCASSQTENGETLSLGHSDCLFWSENGRIWYASADMVRNLDRLPTLEDEGGIVKNAVYVALACILLSSSLVWAVQLESLSLGFHLIPSVERAEGSRSLDLALSLGTTLRLDSENSIDLMVMVDSRPSSLGTSAQFNHRITDQLMAGFGFSVLWPFSEEFELQWPILGTFAHAVTRTYFYPEFWTEASVSFPLLTLANHLDGWKLLPLSELPTLYLAASIQLAAQASLPPRITFQPVITDTTVLRNPIGRISDDLLILPMGSIFLHLRYLP